MGSVDTGTTLSVTKENIASSYMKIPHTAITSKTVPNDTAPIIMNIHPKTQTVFQIILRSPVRFGGKDFDFIKFFKT